MFICVNQIKKSYKECLEKSAMVGAWIHSNFKPNDVILISLRTSFEQLYCFIGCIMYGLIPIIIPHPSTKVHINEFIDKMDKIDSAVSPRLCICDLEDEQVFNKIWTTETKIKYIDVKNIPEFTSDSNDTAFIQLSSGTTGLPKVMKVSHNALKTHCNIYSDFINLNSNDVIISWLPLYHDMGLIATFLLPLLKKVSFVHINPFAWLANPELLFSEIENHHGTLTWMPNFSFSLLSKRCKKSSKNIKSIRHWISCSEVTHYSDLQSFSNTFNIPISNISICYAMAENIFAVSQNNQIREERILSCGKIMDGTMVEIKNGIIWIKSKHMAFPLTLDNDGKFCTGDIGYINNNELYVEGRVDDMIISYGKNIFPYDAETYISEIENVIPGRVACFGIYNKNLGTQLVNVVVECHDITKKETIQNINNTLLSLNIQARIHIKENGYIIKTSSGKISRKRTREKLLKENNG